MGQQQRIRDRLAGHHILLTGSTGFLAKAVIEKLLRAVDTIGGIHLFVRARLDGRSAGQRVAREVIRSRAFDRLRASLGEGFQKLWNEKIHVVAGDLTKQNLGLDTETYSALTRRITLIVNSAATVTFDERIDLAVELNTLGPSRLLKLAVDCGNIPFLHVSTCYVCGNRKGTIIEDDSAPEPAREILPRKDGSGVFDLDQTVETLRAEAAELRHRFGVDTEMCRRKLIEAGMRHARKCGWNDTYTFTKWLGEQRLIRDRGDVPLVLFRPAIIEGSYEEPMRGWIDGLRMADPIIIAFGKGKLNQFPAQSDIAIDFIPVDFVANAIIATLPVGEGWRESLTLYHCASSDRHPLFVEQLRPMLEAAFRRRPMQDDRGRPIRAGRLNLVHRDVFVARWQARQRRIVRLQAFLKALGVRGRRYRRLTSVARQIEQVLYFAKIYSPYTHLDCRFADDNLRGAIDKLHPEDRETFPFQVEKIDWSEYIINRHVPGLRAFVLSAGAEPAPRILAAAQWEEGGADAAADSLRGSNLFDVFRRAAERFGDKPALQIRREGRWVRYSFDQALRATGAIMQRFQERGLRPGDRVAICGESSPEWGLTYLAAMRAGLTAVPLDPQLGATELWSAARFAEAKLLCVSTGTASNMTEQRNELDCGLVVMEEPFIPKPGASRDESPEPVDVPETAVASILFTSGTTVSPKAVRLTHRNFIANASSLIKVHAVSSSDQLLSVLPLYHVFEFTGGFVVPLVCGATITYVEQFKGPEIIHAMQATGTTIMLVVPKLLRMFHDSIQHQVAAAGLFRRGAFRLMRWLAGFMNLEMRRILFRTVQKRFGGRLRMFVCGGSALTPDLFDAFRGLGFEVCEGYGLTETSPVLTVNRPGLARRGSAGPPVPGVELDIRRRNLEGIGEIWVKGPNVMLGYLNNREETEIILENDWLRTGDLGRRDSDGFLYITGRTKDLIVTGAGKNVYPDEAEARYRELPFSQEVCLFGMPAADGLGDNVHLVVVLDQQTSPELDRSSIEREIRLAIEVIDQSLPSHQRVATIHFWERELPKTSTLKAKRGFIREMVEADRFALETAPLEARETHLFPALEAEEESDQLAVVSAILSRQSSCPPQNMRPAMHLHLDLGIDSIGKMDVLGAIETQFGFEIDPEVAAKIARVSDIIKIVAARQPVTRTPGVPVRVLQKKITPASDHAGNGKVAVPLVPLRWLVRCGISAFMNTYVRTRVEGRNHIPRTGAFILAPNHSSHLDSPSVVAAVGGRRRVWIAGAEDYFFNTALKKLLFGKLLDTIPFDRKSDGIAGLRRCGEALRLGDGLLLFPEGTRSVDGSLQAFKIGVAVLAVENNVPIVPVYIDRTFDLLPKGQRFVRPGTVTVQFGAPIASPGEVSGQYRYEMFRTLAKQVEEAVTLLAQKASP